MELVCRLKLHASGFDAGDSVAELKVVARIPAAPSLSSSVKTKQYRRLFWRRRRRV